jgi:mannose-1-phosphate guanylyltransferase/mannose-6-phosphate isomerase
MTLGIQPDRPETGFGYIRFEEQTQNGMQAAYKVSQFVEKPDLTTAESYVQSGLYLWNSGMFMVRASVWHEALQRFRPDIADAVRKAWQGHTQDGCFLRPDAALFSQCSSESIDYAVIEPCAASGYTIGVVPLNAGWSDLGRGMPSGRQVYRIRTRMYVMAM